MPIYPASMRRYYRRATQDTRVHPSRVRDGGRNWWSSSPLAWLLRLWSNEPTATRLTRRGETREEPGQARSEQSTMGVWGDEEIIVDLASPRVAVRGPIEFVAGIDWLREETVALLVRFLRWACNPTAPSTRIIAT